MDPYGNEWKRTRGLRHAPTEDTARLIRESDTRMNEQTRTWGVLWAPTHIHKTQTHRHTQPSTYLTYLSYPTLPTYPTHPTYLHTWGRTWGALGEHGLVVRGRGDELRGGHDEERDDRFDVTGLHLFCVTLCRCVYETGSRGRQDQGNK